MGCTAPLNSLKNTLCTNIKFESMNKLIKIGILIEYMIKCVCIYIYYFFLLLFFLLLFFFFRTVFHTFPTQKRWPSSMKSAIQKFGILKSYLKKKKNFLPQKQRQKTKAIADREYSSAPVEIFREYSFNCNKEFKSHNVNL